MCQHLLIVQNPSRSRTKPVRENTVGNYMVYAFCHVIMWGEQLVGDAASSEREHGKGVAGKRKSWKSVSVQAEHAHEWLGAGWCCSLIAVSRHQDQYELLFCFLS